MTGEPSERISATTPLTTIPSAGVLTTRSPTMKEAAISAPFVWGRELNFMSRNIDEPGSLVKESRQDFTKGETKLQIGLRKLRDYGGSAVFDEPEADAIINAYDGLVGGLKIVRRMALLGVGPDTTPEQCLATIATYVEKVLARG